MKGKFILTKTGFFGYVIDKYLGITPSGRSMTYYLCEQYRRDGFDSRLISVAPDTVIDYCDNDVAPVKMLKERNGIK